MRLPVCLAMCCVAFPAVGESVGSSPQPGPASWQPIEDTVYLQEIGTQVPSDGALLDVAVHEGEVYAATGRGVLALRDGELLPVSGADGEVFELEAVHGALYALAADGLFRMDNGQFVQLSDKAVTAITAHLEKTIVSTTGTLYEVVQGGLEPVPLVGSKPDAFNLTFMPSARAGITGLASYAETVYLLYGGENRNPPGFLIYDGRGFNETDVVEYGAQGNEPSGLPIGGRARDVLKHGNQLLVATSRGLGQLRGGSMTTITGQDGLPIEETTCLAQGFDADVWIGTAQGAVRWVDGAWHWFAAPRWLPSPHVHGITVDAETRTVYVATDGGLGIIAYEPYTLRKKAAYYERFLEEWGQKRLGFVHKLMWNDALGEWEREISDNDAGWSTHYLAAMAFKYAVTDDEAAYAEAQDTFYSLMWMDAATPLDGLPARSIWAKGERGHQAQHGSGYRDAEWHDTADGAWEWKGDTSSDESVAHYYATSVFHDVAAKGADKDFAARHIQRMTDHIIGHGWVLMDVDGEPTRWGRWDPEYVHTPLGNYNVAGNSLQALMFATTAQALVGGEKYENAKQQLMDWGYVEPVIRQKLTYPTWRIFHSDDRLAFYTYWPLLTYEDDPYLRGYYLRSLERAWEIERIEANPWFAFLYANLTGHPAEFGRAVAHLREWPLDLIDHPYDNTVRDDIENTPKGYVPYSGGTRPFSPRVLGPIRWTTETLRLKGGSGRDVVDCSGWLEAYWMGRHFGYITAPRTDDPALTSVPERDAQLGAPPYDGPPRPFTPSK